MDELRRCGETTRLVDKTWLFSTRRRLLVIDVEEMLALTLLPFIVAGRRTGSGGSTLKNRRADDSSDGGSPCTYILRVSKDLTSSV